VHDFYGPTSPGGTVSAWEHRGLEIESVYGGSYIKNRKKKKISTVYAFQKTIRQIIQKQKTLGLTDAMSTMPHV
jgi:hypothetical protein